MIQSQKYTREGWGGLTENEWEMLPFCCSLTFNGQFLLTNEGQSGAAEGLFVLVEANK